VQRLVPEAVVADVDPAAGRGALQDGEPRLPGHRPGPAGVAHERVVELEAHALEEGGDEAKPGAHALDPVTAGAQAGPRRERRRLQHEVAGLGIGVDGDQRVAVPPFDDHLGPPVAEGTGGHAAEPPGFDGHPLSPAKDEVDAGGAPLSPEHLLAGAPAPQGREGAPLEPRGERRRLDEHGCAFHADGHGPAPLVGAHGGDPWRVADGGGARRGRAEGSRGARDALKEAPTTRAGHALRFAHADLPRWRECTGRGKRDGGFLGTRADGSPSE